MLFDKTSSWSGTAYWVFAVNPHVWGSFPYLSPENPVDRALHWNISSDLLVFFPSSLFIHLSSLRKIACNSWIPLFAAADYLLKEPHFFCHCFRFSFEVVLLSESSLFSFHLIFHEHGKESTFCFFDMIPTIIEIFLS